MKEEVRKLRLQRVKRPLSMSHDPRRVAMQQLETARIEMKTREWENQVLGGYTHSNRTMT